MLTARNCGSLTLALPPPVTMRSWTPALSVAVKQPSPSETTVNGRTSDFAANFLDGLLGERALREAGSYRLPVLGGLHRGNEGHLVLGAAPGLAARELAAEVGVVDLHASGELARVLAQSHDLHHLVLEQPGRLVRDTPRWRPSSSADTLFFDWVSRCMARNQLVSGSLVDSKIVPLITLH